MDLSLFFMDVERDFDTATFLVNMSDFSNHTKELGVQTNDFLALVEGENDICASGVDVQVVSLISAFHDQGHWHKLFVLAVIFVVTVVRSIKLDISDNIHTDESSGVVKQQTHLLVLEELPLGEHLILVFLHLLTILVNFVDVCVYIAIECVGILVIFK